jgi:3-hexulose-6-phosphate synthase
MRIAAFPKGELDAMVARRLEIGTPLALSQGTTAVTELRNAFPAHPLVADLKIMEGGYGEAALYADAGADAVVVTGRAHAHRPPGDRRRDHHSGPGGRRLGIDQAVSCPSLGAGVVVFGAPLVIDDEKSFTITDGDLLGALTDAIARVHAREVVYGALP